jgi:hypothetical protein
MLFAPLLLSVILNASCHPEQSEGSFSGFPYETSGFSVEIIADNLRNHKVSAGISGIQKDCFMV